MAAVMVADGAPLGVQDMRDVGALVAQQKAGARRGRRQRDRLRPVRRDEVYAVGRSCSRRRSGARHPRSWLARPAGAGNPGPAFPHIGGQQSAYVVRRLQEYRTGTTTEQDHHLFDMMATVAKNLSDEIQSLGSYL